jgi:hypothetical protein
MKLATGIAAAAALLVACGGGGGGATRSVAPAAPAGTIAAGDTAAAPAAPAAAPRDPIVGQIAHDTPYLFIHRDHTPGGDTVGDSLGSLRAELKPLFAMVTPDMLKDLTDNERMLVAAAHLFIFTDDAALARMGFGRPELQGAFYGHGLAPVLRLGIDGKAAREQLAASAAWAGVAKPFADWHGHPYAAWQLGEKAALVAVFDDTQVAIALARRADEILPHLTGEAPPPNPLDEAALARAGGVTGELTMRLDTDRIAELLDGDGLAALVDAPPGCGPALSRVFGAMAPMTAASTADGGRRSAQFRIGPVPELAAALRAGIRPIAHWPAAAPPPHVTYWGVGAPLRPFVDASAALVADLIGGVAVCTGEAPTDASLDDMLAYGPLAAMVAGFTVLHDATGGKDAPLRLAAVGDVADPLTFYRLAAAAFDLPAKAPRRDKRTRLTVKGTPVDVTLHRAAVTASIGGHDAAALAALRALPPGPAVILALRGGGNPDDASDPHPFASTFTLDGDFLVYAHTSAP